MFGDFMSNLISSYNLATQNKWILTIPYTNIDPSASDQKFCLNLYRYDPPTITVGGAEVGFMGHRIEYPTNTRTESKSLTLNYLLSSNYNQWVFLYKWISKVCNSLGQGNSYTKNGNADIIKKYNIQPTPDVGVGLSDVSIYLLSEFNKPLLEIIYYGSWCSEIGPISADYQAGEQVIVGNFTLKYAYMEVKILETKVNYPFTPVS